MLEWAIRKINSFQKKVLMKILKEYLPKVFKILNNLSQKMIILHHNK